MKEIFGFKPKYLLQIHKNALFADRMELNVLSLGDTLSSNNAMHENLRRHFR